MLARKGGRVAFATWIDGKNLVVADGRRGEPFDFVASPVAMSDDGYVVAYAARLGSEQFCVSGGRRSAPYRDVGLPVVSGDGCVVAFPAFDGRAWFVVRDGVEGPRFDWVGNLVVSDSGALAYTAREAGASFVVAGGRRGPPFDRVTRPALSDDGRVVAYGARERGRWRVVAGEKEMPVDREVVRVFVSGDGRHAGAILEESSGFSVIGPDGKGPSYEWIGWPSVTDDGRVVYFASRGRAKLLVTDERETDLGEMVVWDPVLNREGTEISFGARVGRALWWKVLSLTRSDRLEGVR